MENRTEATEEEIKFCNRLRRLLKQMPPTMRLFADGNLVAVPADYSMHRGESFQPFENVESLCECDGGDPWN